MSIWGYVTLYMLRNIMLRFYLPMAILIIRLKFYGCLASEVFKYNLYVFDKYLYYIDIILVITLIYEVITYIYSNLEEYSVEFNGYFNVFVWLYLIIRFINFSLFVFKFIIPFLNPILIEKISNIYIRSPFILDCFFIICYFIIKKYILK